MLSHLMFAGAFGTDVGFFGTAFTWAFKERELVQDFFEAVTGDRMMYNYFRVGGLAWEPHETFVEDGRWLIERMHAGIHDLDALMTRNEIMIARCRDVGVLSAADAINHGVTGPMLRASGVAFDLRVDEPYSIYDRFEWDIPVGDRGDVYDRFLVRMEEMRQSLRIIGQALDQMPSSGPIVAEGAADPAAAGAGRDLPAPGRPARRVRHLHGLRRQRQALAHEGALALLPQPQRAQAVDRGLVHRRRRHHPGLRRHRAG